MARPTDGWGSPSLSQDIIDNYPDTHHEVDGTLILNDEDYLNSLYDEDNYVDDDFVLFSNHFLAYDDNYIDTSHLKQEFGYLYFAKVFEDSSVNVPKDFGILIK